MENGMTTVHRRDRKKNRPSERAREQPAASGRPGTVLPCLLPACASGVLLWLCYFPVAWGWLGWVALVPLLCLVRSAARPRVVYLSALTGALLFFVPVLQWMRVADPAMYATWLALALHCSLFVLAGVWLLRRLDRGTRLPLVVTLPVVWCALDFLRAHLYGGFAWYFLGHTQHAFLPVIQVADLGGAYAVTFVVAAVNALVFEYLYQWPAFRGRLGLPEPPRPPRRAILRAQTAAVLLLLAADLGYGYWRLSQDTFTPGPRVALLQGSVPQNIRNDTSAGSVDAGKQMFDHYDVLSTLAANAQPRPDLAVWPETCFPGTWNEVAPDVPPDRITPEWRERLADSADAARETPRHWPTNLLLGLDTQVLTADGKSRRYNSSVLILKEGRAAGRYAKIHLVPFGEYLPFKDWLPLMQWLSPYGFDYSVTPGERQTRFALDGYHFGMVICYEDTDPYLARQYARPEGGEPPVDFLVNTSNDGWFDGTAEHEEHLAVARFRAVECRRALLRAVNMGVSAVIDGNGRVLRPETTTATVGDKKVPLWTVPGDGSRAPELPTARWHEFKKVYGVLTAVVPVDHRASAYAIWGDWLPWSCWAVVGAGLLWLLVWRPGAARSSRAGVCPPAV
jgi:apolipoprotein N-acyltransferase